MIVALVIGVIVMLTSLGIDTLRGTSSASQQHHTAEFTALAALEAFVETDPVAADDATKRQEKLTAAVSKAENVAGLNFLLSAPGKKQVENGQIGFSSGISTNTAHRSEAGKLTPGNWWFNKPLVCPAGQTGSCPCVNGAIPNPWRPCFQAATSASATINAFRAEIFTKPTSPLKHVFGRLMKQEDLTIRSEATASLSPRHGMFLIDLSPSIVHDTHLRNGSNVNKYAFQLLGPGAAASNPLCSTMVCACTSDDQPNPCPTKGTPTTGCLFANDGDKVVYDRDSIEDTRGASIGPNTKHYRSDYRCRIVDSFHLLENGVHYGHKALHYLVDTKWERRNPGYPDPNYYIGPEPLTTILAGINSALVEFEKRAVSGDRVGAIGFDTVPSYYQRMFLPSAPGTTGAQKFAELKAMTDVSNPASREAQIQHLFFPRTPEHNWDTIATSTQTVLERTINELKKDPDFSVSDNFIVMFSDNISNCTSNGYCVDTFFTHNFSIHDVQNNWISKLVGERIRLYSIPVGKLSGAHTLVAPSSTGKGCMDNDEAKDANLMFVNPWLDSPANPTRQDYTNAFDQMVKSSAPFMWPNWYYAFAANTGGEYMPLRSPCLDASNKPTDISDTLKAACSAATYGVDPTNPRLPVTVSVPNYTDAKGRLTCDPLGRSPVQQMKDFVGKIMTKNPYVLVEEPVVRNP